MKENQKPSDSQHENNDFADFLDRERRRYGDSVMEFLVSADDGEGTESKPFSLIGGWTIDVSLEDFSYLSEIRGEPIYFYFRDSLLNVDKNLNVEPGNNKTDEHVLKIARSEAAMVSEKKTKERNAPVSSGFSELWKSLRKKLRI